jgi:hypothetical protein
MGYLTGKIARTGTSICKILYQRSYMGNPTDSFFIGTGME